MLYLFSLPPSQQQQGLTYLNHCQDQDHLVFTLDGCYWLLEDLAPLSAQCYALKPHLEARGIHHLPAWVQSITLNTLVELTIKHHPICHWQQHG
jgi:sulfur relay protein TusB/DsrH